MSHRIYILEDDKEMVRIMRRALEELGFMVQDFCLCSEFEKALEADSPNLCLIDLSLPDGDGLTIVSDMLTRRGIPAIIVTGRGEATDRVVGLELGADDYIVKPFEPREMVARVRAVLRRGHLQTGSMPQAKSPRIAKFEGWIADFSCCTLVDPDGKTENLSSAEANMLEMFLSSPGHVLSRSKLMDIGSRDDLDPFHRSIDARVSRLRSKLGDDPKSPKLIRTVYGTGYVFVAKVRWGNG